MKRAYNLPWAEAMQENKKLTAELKALQAELTRLRAVGEAVKTISNACRSMAKVNYNKKLAPCDGCPMLVLVKGKVVCSFQHHDPCDWIKMKDDLSFKQLQQTIKGGEGEKSTDKNTRTIKAKCPDKMKVLGNVECGPRRLMFYGLGPCLCNRENCPKINHPRPKKG